MKDWSASCLRGLATALVTAIAGCGGGGGGGDPTPGPGSVRVSGRVTFDRVPHDPFTSGLDYGATRQDPARGVILEAVAAAGGAVLASTTTDDQGGYRLSVPASTRMLLRARARMLRAGSPAWDFSVVDNTGGQALYVLDGASFDSGTQDAAHDLHAGTGWNGSAYTGARSAAPFAILDSVRVGFDAVLAVAPATQFPPLRLNWSPDNVPSPDQDYATGRIGTTFYTANPDPQIYILGAANDDTDEYDEHVLIHEFGHYLEHQFSRSDSIGGPHTVGDRLDPRVAMGEGWGYAFAGMATGDPAAHDAFGNRQQLGFVIDVERNDQLNPGWYSEGSIEAILYDLFDADSDGVDAVSLGFGPLYEVLTGAQRDAELMTTTRSPAGSRARSGCAHSAARCAPPPCSASAPPLPSSRSCRP
jgi:hypothetical protein